MPATPTTSTTMDGAARPVVVAGLLRAIYREASRRFRTGRHRIIERTFAWINRNNCLATHYERRGDPPCFTAMACSLICLNKLQTRFRKVFVSPHIG